MSPKVLNSEVSCEVVFSTLVSKRLILHYPFYIDPEEKPLCTESVSRCVAMGSLYLPDMWGIHCVPELSTADPFSIFGEARTLIFPVKHLQ